MCFAHCTGGIIMSQAYYNVYNVVMVVVLYFPCACHN